MEKPRPVLVQPPPAALFGDIPEAARQLHESLILKSIRETHDALQKWDAYFQEFRETTVNDSDGDVYVILGKDIREEPQGRCPFLLRAKRIRGNDWKGTEAPGVVIFEDTDGTLTPVIPTYEGTDLTELPEFDISPGQSTWHIHQFDDSGKLSAVHVLIGSEKPEIQQGESILKIATLKKDGTRYYVDTHVGGVYVLTHGSGSSSSSSSSSSSPSSDSQPSDSQPSDSSSAPSDSAPSESGPSDSSKTAIVPFGKEFIGWFAVESPQTMFADVVRVAIDANGEGLARIPKEFLSSTHPDSIMATSAMPDAPVLSCARVVIVGDIPHIYASIEPKQRASVTVRYEAVARTSPPRWKRYTEKQYKKNLAFYAQAHLA